MIIIIRIIMEINFDLLLNLSFNLPDNLKPTIVNKKLMIENITEPIKIYSLFKETPIVKLSILTEKPNKSGLTIFFLSFLSSSIPIIINSIVTINSSLLGIIYKLFIKMFIKWPNNGIIKWYNPTTNE